MDGLGKFDLLLGQIAAAVLAKLIGENEEAVEGRAQLVRHVGEEFRLVLGGERELLRLFLERLACLFHLLVLPFYLLLLESEKPGFFFQLLIGLLQFLLPALQFLRKRLRLFEQILGSGVRFDGVDDDADALRELIQERFVRSAEPRKRCQFQHALDTTFEDHRQDQDVLRRSGTEARRYLQVIRGNIRQVDFRHVDRALPDKAFAQLELAPQCALAHEAVARQQRKTGLPAA